MGFAIGDGVDEEAIVSRTPFDCFRDGRLSGGENQNNVTSAGRLDVPRDAVADAAIARIDAQVAALARLLVAVPAERIDAARERILGHKVEMIVILGPVHVAHLKNQLQRRGGALKNDRVVAGQRAARVIRTPTHFAAPEYLVDAQAGLATALIETGAARRVEWVDGQMRVLTFAGLLVLENIIRQLLNVISLKHERTIELNRQL